jgi:hypothetical protein
MVDAMTDRRIFLLSPARCDGERAKVLFRDTARFELAMRLRTPQGAPLGEAFSFLSGLYFRGKLAYARRFAKPPIGAGGQLIITSNRGLVSADELVTIDDLRAMKLVPIDAGEPNYRGPLTHALGTLSDQSGAACEFVLLGSVATGKYVDPLCDVLGERVTFPGDFVGRGDMSRGGLMLRCVRDNRELSYIPIAGAMRRGKRPARLDRPPARHVGN